MSVIIAAYNASRTINDAVMSALRQEDIAVEVLVCDDASSDDTLRTLARLSDERVTVLQNRRNQGPGISRDRMIDFACGEFLAFLDADDCFLPGRLRRLVAIAREHVGSLVFDDIYAAHDAEKGLAPFGRVHGPRAFGGWSHPNLPRKVSLRDFISARRLLVKPVIPLSRLRSLGVRHSNRRYAEDGLFLWTALARGIAAVYVPEPYYLYRITPGSLSGNPERFTLLAECLDDLAKESLNDADYRAVRARMSDFRELAALRAISGHLSTRKLLAALRYFAGDPARFPRWLISFLMRYQYHKSRRRVGAPTR